MKVCFIAGAKIFFRRQGKRCVLSRVHTGDLLLKASQDHMLALDEVPGIAVGCCGVILQRDVKLHGHLHSIPHSLVIAPHESRYGLDTTHRPLQEGYRMVGMWGSPFNRIGKTASCHPGMSSTANRLPPIWAGDAFKHMCKTVKTLE